ncbi:MAG: polysaccharide biosynthesis protein [Bacteroidaceae bacterium]
MLTLEEVVTKLGEKYTKKTQQIALTMTTRACITGAGGTIGAALCKELFKRGVRDFFLIDQSEFNLYTIHRDLVALGADVVPFLGSYGDVGALVSPMRKFNPTVIYHAGAYKHVPLCEVNWQTALQNNVIEAVKFFRMCRAYQGVEVVVISSDKAVNPTSFMGVTKLLVEFEAVSVLGENNVKIVRFGNVIGSSGSVVPLFYQQLSKGERVTITHEGITRYFMTVAQASNLVINCTGYVGTRFLLNMGDPIHIFDLAKNIASIMGVPFRYEITGLRKGEKMYEELTHDKHAQPISNGEIYSVEEPHYTLVRELTTSLIECEDYDAVKEILQRANIGWRSSTPTAIPSLGYSPEVDDCFTITPSNRP